MIKSEVINLKTFVRYTYNLFPFKNTVEISVKLADFRKVISNIIPYDQVFKPI